METLKKGSRGEAVRAMQRAIGMTDCDGIFGQQTETYLKVWQKAHGLVNDGICGPKTWAAITPLLDKKVIDNLSPAIHSSVVYNPIYEHISKCSRRTPKYLAIHFTAGSQSRPGAAKGVRTVFINRNASADFAVDDEMMLQINPDPQLYYCWAVGDKKDTNGGGASLYGKATNSNTVSIEVCSSLKPGTSPLFSNHEGWHFTDATLNNAVKLAKIIMQKYNIPIERVVRHYDISGKLCPGIIGWNNGTIYTLDRKNSGKKNNSLEWEKFKSRLK